MSAGTHHSECVECDATFASTEEARAHGTETLEAAIAANPDWKGSISGHATTVINPTPEEAEKRKIERVVSWAIESAVDELIRDLERSVDRGEVTAERVRDELRHHADFSEAWDEWMAEVES